MFGKIKHVLFNYWNESKIDVVRPVNELCKKRDESKNDVVRPVDELCKKKGRNKI